MDPSTAFNATGAEGDIARDGFRLYVEPEGVYFIRVGNLDRLEAGGKSLVQELDAQPLTQRLRSDPANFVLKPDDVVNAAIRPGGGSFWRPGNGTWGFTTEKGRVAVLAFHTSLDRMLAEKHLPALFGDKLYVKGARRPKPSE